LIEILNENDIYTNNSCQEQKHMSNMTWICFNGDCVGKLMKLIFKKDIKLYDYLSVSHWEILFDRDHMYNGKHHISLRFPSQDLDYVTNSIRLVFN
jgi:hypothetical protein